MVSVQVKLKNGKTVLIREFREEDRAALAEMYASLSSEAFRWGMPPYDEEKIGKWMSNLPNLIFLVAVHGNRIIGDAHIYKLPHPRR
jgi:RimJ/RimL family protein N-acetyltransferase